jgi:CHASE2 domain-containing sensor protein
MFNELLVIIFIASIILGIISSKNKRPSSILSRIAAVAIILICAVVFGVILQDMWIFHTWLHTLK